MYFKVAEEARFEARQIRLSTEWNKPILLEPAGGSVIIDTALELSGSSIVGHSAAKGLLLASKESNIVLDSSRELLLHSEYSTAIQAHQQLKLTAESVQLSSGLNSPVVLDPRGDSVRLDGLELDGHTISSNQPQGLTVRDRRVDVQGQSVLLQADASALISAHQSLTVSGGALMLESKHDDLVLDAVGHSVQIDSLELDGESLTTVDQFKPLSVRSEDLNMHATGAAFIAGESVRVEAKELLELSGEQVTIKGDMGITLDPGTASVQLQGLSLGGQSVRGTDPFFPLLLSSEHSVVVQAADKVQLRGKQVNLQAANTVDIQADHIELRTTGFNEPVRIKTRGGGLQLEDDGLKLHGSTVSSSDPSRGLRLESAGDIVLQSEEGVYINGGGLDLLRRPIYNVTTLSVDRIVSTWDHKDIHIDPLGEGVLWIKVLPECAE